MPKAAAAFYAVRQGRIPGIYSTWEECKSQVDGFPGARYKKFKTHEEASQFVNSSVANNKLSSSASRASNLPLSSTSEPGRNNSFSKRRSQSSRPSQTRYLPYIMSISSNIKLSQPLPLPQQQQQQLQSNISASPVLITLRPGFTIGSTGIQGYRKPLRLNPVELAAIRHHIPKAYPQNVPANPNEPIIVYTDGASRGNGTKGSKAGIGAFFGYNDPRNVSRPLDGIRQTNQRAELSAVIEAIANIMKFGDRISTDRNNNNLATTNTKDVLKSNGGGQKQQQPILILTDSQYTIKCLNEWIDNWIRKGWKSSTGKDVENRDLIEHCLHLVTKYHPVDSDKSLVYIDYVKAHNGNIGNEAADQLAVQGALSR
ncbi:hypothetical protein H4219_005678 [Mycoemilia scoparia]|uniref:Ribonuclease H n=1 Tax=Mycoemilia scoparia TaxID=417184 RepID=A0A9W8DKM6_9FUNG|nr:hypothetical protein H4219_005678 [Mycoemilia scoparia]